MVTEHLNLDNHSLILASQMILDGVLMTAKTNLPMLPLTQHLCVKDICSSSCLPPAPTCTADVIYENLVIPTVSYCAGLHLTILSLPIRLERVCHLALLFLIPLYTILKDNPGQQDICYNCPHLTVKEQRHIRLKYLAPKLSKPREEAGFSSKLLNAGSSGLACGLGKRTLDQTLR